MNNVKVIQNHRDYFLATIPSNGVPYISKIRTVSFPHKGAGFSSNSLFIKAIVFSKVALPYITIKSLNDMNIPENSYNANRLFHTYKDADNYVKGFNVY